MDATLKLLSVLLKGGTNVVKLGRPACLCLKLDEKLLTSGLNRYGRLVGWFLGKKRN